MLASLITPEDAFGQPAKAGFIIKEKKPVKRRGSLFFLYSLPLEIRRKVTLTIKEPQTNLATPNARRGDSFRFG
jgi:hypothetical protein